MVVVFSFLALNALKYQTPFYVSYTPDEISTQIYGSPEFAISLHVSQELKKSLISGDKIFVWSANPEIYYYLGKQSPTKYFNYLAWMKNSSRDVEIFEDLVVAKPEYIICGSYSLPFSELFQYIKNNYKMYFRAGNVVVYKKITSNE